VMLMRIYPVVGGPLPTVYSVNGGSCVPYETPSTYYATGPEVPPTEFVASTIEYE
jgi:hypothetical protein